MVDRKKFEEKFIAHNFKDFRWIDPKKIEVLSEYTKKMNRYAFLMIE